MVSILKSIWKVSSRGQQMVIIVAINFLYLGFFFGFHFAGMIPMVFVQLANIVFWMIMGAILLFGPFWSIQLKTK